MGWKNLKEHYRIGHIVQVRKKDGKTAVVIGSGYVSELIIVSLDGSVKEGTLGVSGNADLERYLAEMKADGPEKVRAILEAPDTFTASIPVYTYDGADIVEKWCEVRGWPNCTHDGVLMYENTFFATKDGAVAKAKRNAEAGIEIWTENVAEAEKALVTKRGYLEEARANLAKLNADYPA